MSEFWKAPFKIFGMAFFSLISFIVLLFLFSLFFVGMGLGLGGVMGKSGISDLSDTATTSPYTYVSGDKESENLLLEISVEGLILGSPSREFSSPMNWGGVTYGYELQDLLKEAAKNESVKGILLHMQTPGGTIFGSMAISEGIEAYRNATQNPVVVYIEGLSASGGVMAMAGADAIYADYGSMIGSIGVIGGMLTYFDQPVATEGGLLGGGIQTRGGIEQTVISAGRSKDLGNPFRRATPEEIAVLQQGVDTEYDRFVRHVATHRNISENLIRETMGAQIFDNKTAHEYGLTDGTMSRDAVIKKLAEMAKTDKDFRLMQPKNGKKKFWEEVFSISQYGADRTTAHRRAVQRDICQAAARMPMVYHGDIRALCASCEENPLY
ncbi:S49 family peptidase [Desulfonema ishimotonii]|uniref:S49 family peptidase n=1 Tax=Desulfonema ishimotonii TaxID=45657 RepID=A0A401FVW2_9BACT|nr:S49 family peptidase [Desulfonema ishimotonii]GBC61098.1 S49 family peptidase [Desulfonema ishimotonii]